MASAEELFAALLAKDWNGAPKYVHRHTASVVMTDTRPEFAGCYALHLSLIRRAPAALVIAILRAFPTAAKECRYCNSTQLPLHIALHYKADEQAILAILRAWPAAASKPHSIGDLSNSVAQSLLDRYTHNMVPRAQRLQQDAFVAAVAHGHPETLFTKMKSAFPTVYGFRREDICVAACRRGMSRQFIANLFLEGVCPRRVIERTEMYCLKGPHVWEWSGPFTCLEAMHASDATHHFGADTLLQLSTIMRGRLEHLFGVVEAGVSTKQGFWKANRELREQLNRTPSNVALVTRCRLLRAWHRGEAIYRSFLTFTLWKVLPRPAAVAVVDMLRPICDINGCSCHVFAASIWREDTGRFALQGGQLAFGNQHQEEEEEKEEEEEDCVHTVIQEVHHEQPAAWYHPIEARDISQLRWASFVHGRAAAEAARADALSIATSNGQSLERGNASDEAVFLIRFNRRPQAMHDRLAHSAALKACREALAGEGFDWKLSSGPSLFVHPWQYMSVVRALPEFGLNNSDVAIAESLEYLLEESLVSAGRGVWAKTRERVPRNGNYSSSCQGTEGTCDVEVAMPGLQDGQHWHDVADVTRSFLCITPAWRNAASVTQSTTNSRMLRCANPRRAPDCGWD